MRCKSILAAAVLSLASVRADVVDDVKEAAEDASSSVQSAAEAATASSSSVARPQFTPTTLKAPFLEQFTDDWEERWRVSHAIKATDKDSEEEWAYVGTWAVEEPSVLKGIEGDMGLIVKDKAAHHAISAKFSEALSNEGKTLVAQYEVKLQDGLECGGAYMKLLQNNDALHAEEFSNASPYIIMFGPDKCGTTNKVHFIFRHKNPNTGEYEEKHLQTPPLARITKLTSLYTLIVRPDQTYEIRIDGNTAKSGSLFEDFTPAINPPEEIEDPNDTKPDDWVNNARIPDPDATKPDDWDEDAPFEIPDEHATKPDDWLEDEPLMVPDPEAEKPEDWDDEEDGDWIPPSVPNPKCDEVSGCGVWTAPMIKNPAYKGKWEPPTIDNPEYKGVWKPRKITNPEHFEDKTPANFEPMGAIGFEIWTMQKDILFDNIYLGHSVEEAEQFANETYTVKRAIEKAEEDASAPAKDSNKAHDDFSFKEDPLTWLRNRADVYKNKIDVFVDIAKQDPIQAVKIVPEIAGGIGILLATVVVLLMSLIGGGGAAAASAGEGPKAPPKIYVKQPTDKTTEEVAAEEQEKVAEAISSGADKTPAEVNRRTTRSTAAAS